MKMYYEQLYANKFENFKQHGKIPWKTQPTKLTKQMEKLNHSTLIRDWVCIEKLI